MNERTDWDAYLSVRTKAAYTDKILLRPFLHGDVLEIGCGYGDFAAWCAEEAGCRVTALDPSADAIAQASRRFPGVRFLTGVAESLPFENAAFDAVISLEVAEHLADPRKYFAESFRVLRPGGWMIVQTPNYPVKRVYDLIYRLLRRTPSWKDDPTHISPFTFKKMKQLATQSGFRIERLQARNILGEKRLPWLAKAKSGRAGSCLGQKMILIAQKPPAETPSPS